MLFTLFMLWSEPKQHIRIHTLHMLFTYVIQNGAIEWRGGDELLNKVVILVFFVHKIVLIGS